jgi:hypothetical protein
MFFMNTPIKICAGLVAALFVFSAMATDGQAQSLPVQCKAAIAAAEKALSSPDSNAASGTKEAAERLLDRAKGFMETRKFKGCIKVANHAAAIMK